MADLKALGSYTQYTYDKPDASILERFSSPSSALSIFIEAPEFTSLCPITGQPDFATIVINYTPDRWCIESKSLKLYLGSFRMHGDFHESCTARIGVDLSQFIEPLTLRVEGRFTPRGGIKFWPLYEYTR